MQETHTDMNTYKTWLVIFELCKSHILSPLLFLNPRTLAKLHFHTSLTAQKKTHASGTEHIVFEM